MEEFRAPIADRTVLALINLGMVRPDMFEIGEDEGVYLAEAGRKILLKEWNRRRCRRLRCRSWDRKFPRDCCPIWPQKNWPPICGANCLHTSRFDGGELR